MRCTWTVRTVNIVETVDSDLERDSVTGRSRRWSRMTKWAVFSRQQREEEEEGLALGDRYILPDILQLKQLVYSPGSGTRYTQPRMLPKHG